MSSWAIETYTQHADHLPSSGQTPASQPTYSELLAENGRLRSLALETSSEKTARPVSSLALLDQQEQELYLCLRTHYRPAGISTTSQVIYPSEDCCNVIFTQAAKWAWLHSAVSPETLEQQRHHFNASKIGNDPSNASEASWLALYFSYLTVRESCSSLRRKKLSNPALIDRNHIFKSGHST